MKEKKSKAARLSSVKLLNISAFSPPCLLIKGFSKCALLRDGQCVFYCVLDLFFGPHFSSFSFQLQF